MKRPQLSPTKPTEIIFVGFVGFLHEALPAGAVTSITLPNVRVAERRAWDVPQALRSTWAPRPVRSSRSSYSVAKSVIAKVVSETEQQTLPPSMSPAEIAAGIAKDRFAD